MYCPTDGGFTVAPSSQKITSLSLFLCISLVPLHADELIVPRYESTGNPAFTIGLLALGLLIGLLAYTLFLAISTRELMFVYFSIIMLLLTILQTFAAYDRFLFSLTYNRVTVITHLLFITFLLFFEDFFSLEQHLPALSRFNRISILVIAGYTVFFLLAKFLFPQSQIVHASVDFVRELFVFYTNILFLYTIIRAIRWMHTDALLILIAFIPPAVLTSINAMQIFPFMDRHAAFVGLLMTYNQPIGLSLQAILFSLAMGNRYNRIKLERQQSMQERDRLQVIDAEKTEFFMNMSHELRTPLTIIIGMVRQMRRGKFGDSIRANDRILDTIERNGLRLLKQVNHVLRMGSIDPQKPVTPLVIAPALRLIVDEFSPVASERGMRLTYRDELHPTSTEHHTLMLRRDDFETMVMNLLSNAIKFTPDGGSIVVTLGISEDGAITISVQDTGVGISADDQQRIFGRFYHGQPQFSQMQTGLGLALVQSIMEQYGGSVTVESIPDEGSTFTLSFPPTIVGLQSQNEERIVSESPLHPGAEMGPLYTGELSETKPIAVANSDTVKDKPLILVVDDNADMCAFVATILGEHYRMICAHEAQEGLDTIATQRVDLIICDIMMPRMNGHEFLAELKRRTLQRPIPLIFLTARDSEQEKIGSLKEGAVHFITKPFSEEVLLATVARTLAHDREIRSSQADIMRRRIDQVFDELDSPTTHENLRMPLGRLRQFAQEVHLSEREVEVLALLLDGKSDKEIAVTLDLSVKTVANHNRHLYQKAKVSGRYELITHLFSQPG